MSWQIALPIPRFCAQSVEMSLFYYRETYGTGYDDSFQGSHIIGEGLRKDKLMNIAKVRRDVKRDEVDASREGLASFFMRIRFMAS